MKNKNKMEGNKMSKLKIKEQILEDVKECRNWDSETCALIEAWKRGFDFFKTKIKDCKEELQELDFAEFTEKNINKIFNKHFGGKK